MPTGIDGFNVLGELGVTDLLSDEAIEGYLRISGVDDLTVDKFINYLYVNVGKVQGIRQTTIKKIVESIVKKIRQESLPEEGSFADGDFIKENGYTLVYRKLTLAGAVYEMFTNFRVNIIGHIARSNGDVDILVTLDNGIDPIRDLLISPEMRASESKFVEELSRIPGYSYLVPQARNFHTIFMAYLISKEAPKWLAPESIGKQPTGEWLLPDAGISLDGKYVEATEDGTIALKEGVYLSPTKYLPGSLLGLEMVLPHKEHGITVEDRLKLIKKFREVYYKDTGITALGYIMSCYIKDIIINDLGWGFPVLYITGNAESR